MKETNLDTAPQPAEKIEAAPPTEKLSADIAIVKYYSQLLENPEKIDLPGQPEENRRFILTRAKTLSGAYLIKKPGCYWKKK